MDLTGLTNWYDDDDDDDDNTNTTPPAASDTATAATVTQVDPATVTEVDPATVTLVDPATFTQDDPATATQVDPATVKPVDHATVTAVDPATVTEVDPAIVTEVGPATVTEVDPATDTEVDPATVKPVDPATVTQVDPANQSKVLDQSNLLNVVPVETSSEQRSSDEAAMEPLGVSTGARRRDPPPPNRKSRSSLSCNQNPRRNQERFLQTPTQAGEACSSIMKLGAVVEDVKQKIHCIEEYEKEIIVVRFITNMDPKDKVVVFCNTKDTAADIGMALTLKGLPCRLVHSDLCISERSGSLRDFTHGDINILLTTEFYCDEINVCKLTHVINFDYPGSIQQYMDRLERTGRSGKGGILMSCFTKNDAAFARDLILILEESKQVVPDELEQMARRFDAMSVIGKGSARFYRRRPRFPGDDLP